MIQKAMVIGAGVMGAQIAGHLANCGLEVILLDILPFDESLAKKDRNAFANKGLAGLAKLNPAPMMDSSFISRIRAGNLEDDIELVNQVDWVIEAIIEKLEIKQDLFKKIDKALKRDDVLVTTNTSGISISEISKGLSDRFCKNFFGTHFFNPPRYLHLMEVIPGPKTDKDVMGKLCCFMSGRLGKGVVMCKDTPNFIGNRVGVHAMMVPFQEMKAANLNYAEVDALTGPLIGRPKSATFRTADVVGLDTMVHVLGTLETKLKNDPEVSVYKIPDVLNKLVQKKSLGEKTGAGFFKKDKSTGKTVILTLDPVSMEYKEATVREFSDIADFVKIPDIREKIKMLVSSQGEAGTFLWKILSRSMHYAALTCCEIAHDIQSVDEALKFGFGWALGPFEIWDALGLKETADRMSKDGLKVPEWVVKHIDSGAKSFYELKDNGEFNRVNPFKGGWEPVFERGLHLTVAKKRGKTVYENKSVSLVEIGDGIVCLEFHSHMNSAGTELINSIIETTKIAEDKYRGMIIGNHGQHFCVGANLKELVEAVKDGKFDLARKMIRKFQEASMSIKYCNVPVVVAGHGMALGGGCEFIMHSQNPVLAGESYIGLVEIGVGLLPAGGGTKEFAIKASEAFAKNGDWNKPLTNALETLGMAKVGTSGIDSNNIYLNSKAKIVMNQDSLLTEAKKLALYLSNSGYNPGVPRKDILVAGDAGYGLLDIALYTYEQARMISEHDGKICREIAKILTGGGLTNPTVVSEEYLLDLELESFIGLLHEEKTVARVEHMLKKGKPLRN